MPRARLCFLIPLAVALDCFVALGAMALMGWPGEHGVSAFQFCEAIQNGFVAQPANTFSNLGFLAVGLGIGWQASRDVAARKAATWSNRMVTTVFYPATSASCSILIGAGSTSLHASTTHWGAELDHLTMHLWGAWMIAYATTRLLRLGDRQFVQMWMAQVVALSARLAFGEPYTIKGSTLFGTMVATSVAIELVGCWRNRRRQKTDLRYLAWGAVTFLAAYACFLASGTEGPWCNPYSLWQGHAVWHLLCAGATAFVYLYARSERLLVAMPQD
jgi:hypothetical protein